MSDRLPQNPATDIDKTWSREFDCNRSANDLFRTLISSLLLPLYCAIETFWTRRAEPSQKKALLIDWAFAITWLLVWLAFLFYAFWKYAPGL